MGYLVYYLLIKPLSLLPLPILYLLSNSTYWILYRLIGYRKKVVIGNMQRSFPEKTPAEIKQLARLFYQHFFDTIIESVKLFSISKEELMARFRVVNPELMDHFFEEGKSVILNAGHYNSWEMAAAAINPLVKHQVTAIYAPLKNKAFEHFIRASRTRFGLELTRRKDSISLFEETKKRPIIILIASDQSPSDSYRAYWMRFLNQDTAVLFGTEKYAKDYDLPVIMGKIAKVKRGYYTIEFELVTDTPQAEPYGAITQKHTRILEKQIQEHPQYWLWTHRRWKREKPADVIVHD
ncbi:MAG: lysophospholipid acyltransferase family protein [Lewinellaceae bacterium]|nr:lysophospholipid acyltransferase family protein [Lewinellaceae bacterium]